MSNFSSQLTNYLQELTSLRDKNVSEDAIRASFLRFLDTAFPNLQASEINLEQYIKLPAHVAGAQIHHGFADAVYGDLVFEFKRALDDASRLKGESELEKYLKALPYPERYFGFLTDGETVRVYNLTDMHLNSVDNFRLDATKAGDVFLRLDTYLFHARNVRPTARDIALRFGEHSPVFLGSMHLLRRMWLQVRDTAASHTKLTQWQNLLSVVYGAPVGNEDLFLRHAYLVYFARLLAFATIQLRVPSTTETHGVLTGEVFAQMGFAEFVADDFFAWANNAIIQDEVTNWLSSVAVLLGASYDLRQIDEDLLKALYQELVDPITRHDLGEHYTPDWLAEHTLEEAGYPVLDSTGKPFADERNTLLDPTCGSGTFLFIGIHRLRKAGLHGEKLINFIQQHLAGIEIHPLAVVIAKANLLLAMGADLRQFHGALRLPIYMANALELVHNKPQPFIRVSVDVDNLSRLTGKSKPNNLPTNFHLPFAEEAPTDYIDKAVDALITFANPLEYDELEGKQGLETTLARLSPNNQLLQQQMSYWLGNLRLMRWLLQEPATDSVWRFILLNAFRPQLLSHRRFAFVAGNPPWLAYRYIQSRTFQDTVRSLIFEHGLAQKDKTNLFTQMDTSTLFYAFSQWRYATQKGVLAFVLPRSILTGAKQHSAFQEAYLRRARLILDLKGVAPLFPVPACVVIAKLDNRARDIIPVRAFSGDLPSHNLDWEAAKPHLTMRKESFRLLAPGEASPYLKDIINGSNLYPRSFWFVHPSSIAKMIDLNKPWLETDPASQKQAKAPWKGLTLKGAVESSFLYATLLSDNLLPFGVRALSLVVLPILNQHLLSDIELANQGYSGLRAWLKQARDLWKTHGKSKEDLLFYINWQNKLTRQRTSGGYRVITNKSGTYITACVVEVPKSHHRELDGLPVQGLVADNTTFYFYTDSASEAHYLAAYLNAPSVDESIKPYQSEGAFGAQAGGGQRDICRRPFEVLPWPRYNAKDTRHEALADLGREAHVRVTAWLETAPENVRSSPMGRLRSRIREEVLAPLLAQIDALVNEILASDSAAPKMLRERAMFEYDTDALRGQ